MNINISKLQ